VAAEGLRRRWPLLVVLGLVLASVLLHLWWLNRFRDGFPLDIDEARYMEFGLDLKDRLDDDGIRGMWHAWKVQDAFGPLLPLTSVPVYTAFGASVMSGLVTQLGFFALLVLATYGIGARLTSPAGGALAAFVVATTPAVVDFTRTYQFAVTAAAMLAACTYALLASDGLARRRWSVTWGVLLGLMVLARTMTVAFVPAQLLAAVWLALARPGPRRTRIVNLGIAAAAAVVTAAIWLATSWDSVWSYLTDLGYGGESGAFGTTESRLSVGYWTRQVTDTVEDDLYVPLAVLLGVGLVLGLVACIPRLRGRIRAWASTDTAVVILVVVEGYLALTSSRNEGVGFRLALIPGLVALAVAGIWSLRQPAVRGVLVAALIAVCALNLVAKANVVDAFWESEQHQNGYIQNYVIGALEARQGPSTHPLPDSQKRWMAAYREVVEHIGRPRVTALATDEPLVNVNDLTLAARLRLHEDLPVLTLSAPAGPPTQSAYREVLSREPVADVLVTVSRLGLSYPALTGGQSIDQQLMRRTARSLGFTQVATVALPNDRSAILMVR
jgi:4-amino-4-deoxy-L-arabinose transferase-like glycosyltransferase